MSALLMGLVLAQATAQAPAVPAFTMSRWLNVEKPVAVNDYKGKVVVLHVSAGFC
jgi:hypothetical protein